MASREAKSKKACCMISEMLEEAGFDRARARQLRRQILEGVVLMCQWQLERMAQTEAAPAPRKARRVTLD
jgi:hypothetical protein